MNQLANQTRDRHRKGFDELIGNYSLKDLNHRLHFLKGDPAALITDLAAEHAIDLIIMGTVCRTGVAGFFIGNTAENVPQLVDCSVLTVKPEGFVSEEGPRFICHAPGLVMTLKRDLIWVKPFGPVLTKQRE